jgi:adhesin transport system outer membrane protein
MNTNNSHFKRTVLALALCTLGASAQAQSFTEVVQSALTVYPSLLSAKAKTEAARSDIDRARAAHYPQISYGYTQSKYESTTLPGTIKPTAATPSVSLNLWSGGRIEADAERAEALTMSGEKGEAMTREDVALQASEAYINWARAIDMHALASSNVESLRITLNDIQRIVDVDGGRRIDLDQAKVRMDNALLAQLQRQTELAQARQRLSRFWQGRLPNKPMGLKEVMDNGGRLSAMPRSMEQVMDKVSDDLPVIAQQKAQVEAAQSAIDMARGQYWPTLDVAATRQLNALNTFPQTYKEDTFTQIKLNMPLYSGGSTSASVRGAVSQLTAAQNGLEEARLQAREKAAVAYQEWMSAQSRAKQGAEQARVGDRVVEGYRNQFRLARRQLLDLLNIQSEAFNYQSAATSAFYDEQISRARLLASMGNLAERF